MQIIDPAPSSKEDVARDRTNRLLDANSKSPHYSYSQDPLPPPAFHWRRVSERRLIE